MAHKFPMCFESDMSFVQSVLDPPPQLGSLLKFTDGQAKSLQCVGEEETPTKPLYHLFIAFIMWWIAFD